MGKKESFTILPTRIVLSKHLNNVSVNARWLFIVMLTEWRSGEGADGAFKFPYREIRNSTHFSFNTISSCIAELEKAGLLVRIKGGLQRNANKYVVNYRWIALGTQEEAARRTTPPTPIKLTLAEEKGLGGLVAMSHEAASNVELDTEKVFQV